MGFEEIKAKLNALLGYATPENQAATSETLTEISDEIEKIFNENKTNADKVTELTANNETLRAVNAKLFLKVGQTDSNPPAPTPTPAEPENKISFDDLFNEKGELK